LDLSAVAAIVIAVPGSWDLSATGDFAHFVAFDTATFSVPDDVFTGSFTGNLNTDAAGTSGHVIEVNGTITGDITVDQEYWLFEDLTLSGTMNVSAANTVIQRVIITP